MASVTLNFNDIVNIIWGASLMGGGGGGAVSDGMNLLNTYVTDNLGGDTTQVALNMIDSSDMDPTAFAAVTAGLGAPTALQGRDFTPYVVNAFNLLKSIAAGTGQNLQYSMAIELGGFNTFIPMLISLRNGIPFINVDGSGRAVPGLDTLLLHVNGNNTSPLAMADDVNDKVQIILDDPKNAVLAENIARGVAVAFGSISGLSGWLIQSAAIGTTLPIGSIALCQQIGQVLQDTTITDKLGTLSSRGILTCREVARGNVTAGGTSQVGGFDIGFVEAAGFRVDFHNENLVLSQGSGSIGTVLMTAPDIICTFDVATGQPLTNADLFDASGNLINREISIGMIKVNDAWFQTGITAVNAIWQVYFQRVAYNGAIVQYS